MKFPPLTSVVHHFLEDRRTDRLNPRGVGRASHSAVGQTQGGRGGNNYQKLDNTKNNDEDDERTTQEQGKRDIVVVGTNLQPINYQQLSTAINTTISIIVVDSLQTTATAESLTKLYLYLARPLQVLFFHIIRKL